ncbi:MAG: hydrogenase maturation nickel metallochaperone HypA [Chloroflexi bacterium]|nr:hydrogenase maturation nickel metallochaperone HypA [Chloroflexota bacterium]
MNRLVYLGVFVASALILAVGVLFLCAAMTAPGRLLLAIVLLAVGAAGAGWSAFSYRRWAGVQPAALAARVTDLAAQNGGELAVSQIMSAFDVEASAATAAIEELRQTGQCRREPRADQVVYVFPGLKEHKVVRRCAFCGSTFPVKQALAKCPNCGGNLELVKE